MTKYQIYNHLRDNPGRYKTRLLAKQLGASQSVVYVALKMLEFEGIVTREGNGKNTIWIVS